MELRVPDSQSSVRLDRFLKEQLPELPRSGLFAALRKGRIRVNGTRVKEAAHRLAPGDRIEIAGYRSEPSPNGHARSEGARRPMGEGGRSQEGRRARAGGAAPPRESFRPRSFAVLFEDEALLVLDKAAGTSVHPGAKTGGTLIDELAAYARTRRFEPHLVHRLDRYTSGVMVVAKSREVAGKLGAALREHANQGAGKRYVALVFGEPPRQMRVDSPLDGRPAVTSLSVRERLRAEDGPFALLDVEISSGRKHQIRRHLAQAGFPIVGDELYGDWRRNRSFAAPRRIRGPLLHAAFIELVHPLSGTRRRFEAPIPAFFAELIAELRRAAAERGGMTGDRRGAGDKNE